MAICKSHFSTNYSCFYRSCIYISFVYAWNMDKYVVVIYIRLSFPHKGFLCAFPNMSNNLGRKAIDTSVLCIAAVFIALIGTIRVAIWYSLELMSETFDSQNVALIWSLPRAPLICMNKLVSWWLIHFTDTFSGLYLNQSSIIHHHHNFLLLR